MTQDGRVTITPNKSQCMLRIPRGQTALTENVLNSLTHLQANTANFPSHHKSLNSMYASL